MVLSLEETSESFVLVLAAISAPFIWETASTNADSIASVSVDPLPEVSTVLISIFEKRIEGKRKNKNRYLDI